MPKFTLYVITRRTGCGPGARTWRAGACEQLDDSNAATSAAGIANACHVVITIDAAPATPRRQVTDRMQLPEHSSLFRRGRAHAHHADRMRSACEKPDVRARVRRYSA